MKPFLLMTLPLLLLVQLDNTDHIRKEPRVPDPLSAESQFRMYAYLSQFVRTCDSYFTINRPVADVALTEFKTNAVSMRGTSSAHELYEDAVKIEDEIRTFSIKLVGPKSWCELNKFVLTAHGYGRIFKKNEEEQK